MWFWDTSRVRRSLEGMPARVQSSQVALCSVPPMFRKRCAERTLHDCFVCQYNSSGTGVGEPHGEQDYNGTLLDIPLAEPHVAGQCKHRV